MGRLDWRGWGGEGWGLCVDAVGVGVKLYLGDGLVIGDEFDVSVDKAGLWSGTQRFWCHEGDLAMAMPEPGSEHPKYPFLAMDSARASYHAGEAMEIVAIYAGLNATFGEGAVVPAPEYWLDVTTSDEPLATHPRYASLDAQDAAEAVELAINPPKDDAGESLVEVDTTGWDAMKLELYDKTRTGIEAFRDPKVIWGKRWVSEALPSNLNATGEIDTPDGGPPSLGGDRNWMYLGARTRIRGKVYEIEESWEASGRGGWDSDLYSE